MLRRAWLVVTLLAVCGLSACDFTYPRDPNETLERVLAAGAMRVVAVDHVPWVTVEEDGSPSGVEVDLVEAFARDLGVTVEWRRAPAFEAVEALKRNDADLAIGGFTTTAIAGHEGAAQSYAYFKEALVVATEPGAPVPEDLDGLEVHAAPELMADGLIERKGGVPVPQTTEALSLFAVPDWQVQARGLVPTGIVLHRDEHVIAVPRGENAWIMRLERFLRAETDDVADKLREYAP